MVIQGSEKEQRKEGKKEGRKEGRKERRKEGKKARNLQLLQSISHISRSKLRKPFHSQRI